MPRLYLLFHVPQQFLFDRVLRAAHLAAADPGGGAQRPPIPPTRPRRLRASRLSAPRARQSPRPPRSPPAAAAAAAATARCCAPQPSSEPRTDVRSLARPLPTAGGGVGGCAPPRGGVERGGRLRVPGGGVPGRAPHGPLSWQRAGSSPEGANPHCERQSPALHSAGLGRRGAPLDPPTPRRLRGASCSCESWPHPAGCSVIPTRSISRREGLGPPRLESDYWEAHVGPPAGRKAVAHHRFFKSPCRLGALRCKACWWRSGRAAAPVCRGAVGCESARVTVTTRLAFLAATWDVGARVGVTGTRRNWHGNWR